MSSETVRVVVLALVVSMLMSSTAIMIELSKKHAVPDDKWTSGKTSGYGYLFFSATFFVELLKLVVSGILYYIDVHYMNGR